LQQAQLRALQAQGMADAGMLSSKLDAIMTATSCAENDAAALTEDLMQVHAEAMEQLEFIVSASNNALSAEASIQPAHALLPAYAVAQSSSLTRCPPVWCRVSAKRRRRARR
jgi:hypothetical protein